MKSLNLLKCACADCGEIITYLPAKIGKVIKCPKCGAKSKLPAAPPTPADADSDSYSSAEFSAARPRTCPVCGDRLGRNDLSCGGCEARKHRKRQLLVRTMAGVAALAVVAAVLPMVHWPSRKPAANPIPPNGTSLPQPKVIVAKSPDNLKVGRFTVQRQRGSDVTIMTGDVENASDDLRRSVRVSLDLLDAQGTKVDTIGDFITELPARGVWHVVGRVTQTNVTTVRLASIKENP